MGFASFDRFRGLGSWVLVSFGGFLGLGSWVLVSFGGFLGLGSWVLVSFRSADPWDGIASVPSDSFRRFTKREPCA